MSERERERKREKGRKKKKGQRERGNELHARRTTRCNFCKVEIHILPLKVLLHTLRKKRNTTKQSEIVFERERKKERERESERE